MPKPKSQAETEVVPIAQNDRRQRRRFSADEKARILAEAERCTERGQLGELLRREGIYSSQLANWRAQQREAGNGGLTGKRPGPRPLKDNKDRIIEQQQRQIAKLEKEVRISTALIELQKKAHEILGIALPKVEDASMDEPSSSFNSALRRSR